ncbi:DUF2059 domain-containing protein [Sphingobium indicum]|uniref:DUF2059 domain-containing protein n=3 Tax=Sphingobium indicum TaxID=332055 RepID=A0A1L5BRQ8_SPHIB|nr:DUF2059 domain-containing protein [Sphingobium indicum]APL95556.1 hypothetical protein SIDU_14110 [Sphingobium indicum B90A]KEZ00651.1 hypothetical protein AI27_02990 [Sphingomonas sp. BHC-A]NYI23126.1 hypothetical protein [Sphingobium indicum]RYM01802.1 DUF2059 domain-containing protein [Sphingobium indicum]
MIACLIMLAAASTAAQSSATQIAQATFQPERAIADALAQWDAQFDAGVTRASVGRTMTADQEARKNRAKAAGKAELSQQLRTTGIPKMLHLIEADYIQNFSEEELREAAIFWTSPAGQAFTTAMQEAVKNGTGRIVPPAQHAAAINRYMTSATGRKESVRSGILRPVLAKEMGLFMQQAQPKIDARMRAAMSAAS